MIGWAVLLVMLVVVVAVIASGASPGPGRSSARARLDERLAAGDLTVEEHAERVAVLDRSPDRRDVPWVAIAVAAVLLIVLGTVGWAAGGASMGWWGDHDRMMGGHMGWGSSSGDADAPVAGAREVRVTATDLAFAPGALTVQAGEVVNVTLANDGEVFHDLSIPELGFVLDAEPGQTVSGSLVVDEPGTYEFVCSVPGHAQAGMRGTMQVVEGSR